MKLKIDKSVITAKNIVFAVFVAIELIIYLTFNIITAKISGDTIYLKYSGILVCLAATATMLYFYKCDKDAVTLVCALAVTAISDLFILVMDKYYEIGLITFITVQSVYFYRLYTGRVKRIAISAAVRAALIVGLLITMSQVSEMSFLVAEVCVYIVMLVCNVADAYVICSRGIKNIFFAVGLTLFLCCDICVGLHNFKNVLDVELPAKLLNFVSFAIWAFYLPSQVLIVLSVKEGGLNNRVEKDERKDKKIY